jgi:hypothetical protein
MARHCAKRWPRAPTVIDVMTSLEVAFADITSRLAKDASPRKR